MAVVTVMVPLTPAVFAVRSVPPEASVNEPVPDIWFVPAIRVPLTVNTGLSVAVVITTLESKVNVLELFTVKGVRVELVEEP